MLYWWAVHCPLGKVDDLWKESSLTSKKAFAIRRSHCVSYSYNVYLIVTTNNQVLNDYMERRTAVKNAWIF